jgi:hypothetical protein
MPLAPVIDNFFVELFPIEPRYTEEIRPRPRPDPAQQIATRAILTHAVAQIAKDNPDADPHDGPTQGDILLRAIVLVARREPQTPVTRGALRNLIAKFSCECGGFLARVFVRRQAVKETRAIG